MEQTSENTSPIPSSEHAPYTQQEPPQQPHAPTTLQESERKHRHRSSAALLAVILIVGLIGGGLIGYSLSYVTFNGRISDLQAQIQNLPPTNATYVSYPNSTYVLNNNVSLATLYSQVKASVVVIQGLVPQYNIFGRLAGYAQQQGSGFVALANNEPVIVTNNHVTQGASNITVTFANGDSYPAIQLGSDPYADLAVLSVSANSADLNPLVVVSSTNLQVGDPVVAVGSPYGLSGTLTTGVISALGRTITETSNALDSGINIPDVIQTSTPINPGNSGGPLVNYNGEVVGITTAGISESEGLGFAIPSETILREIDSLVASGSYNQHPTINVAGTDMNYQIAQAMGIDITYGFLVESVSVQNGLRGGDRQVVAGAARVTIGGDVILGIEDTRITNTDEMLSYLEQHTLPGQTVDFMVLRDGQVQTIQVTIGKLA